MRYSPLVLESRHNNPKVTHKTNDRKINHSPDRKGRDMSPSCLAVVHQSYNVRYSTRALKFSQSNHIKEGCITIIKKIELNN